MTKLCPECGIENKVNAVFCNGTDCGKMFADTSIPQAAASTPARQQSTAPQMTQHERDAILYGGPPPLPATPVQPSNFVSPVVSDNSVNPAIESISVAPGRGGGHPTASSAPQRFFSIAVKVACVAIFLFAFLPFVSVSCEGASLSLNAYELATGNIAGSVADSASELDLGAPSAAEMEQLNQMVPSNAILMGSYAGILLLLAVSFVPTLRKIELLLAVIAPTFHLAIIVQLIGTYMGLNRAMNLVSGAIPFGVGPIMQASIGIGAITTVLACLILLGLATSELWQRCRG
ncbi:MAG: hypothetical protein FWC86_01565 [Coriobacteriia bacterium]|nr:hypothetical protein [Coriobacteriia bacterium]